MQLAHLNVATTAQIAQLMKTSASVRAIAATSSSLKPGIPHQPGRGDIPMSWAQNFMPPGFPLSPLAPQLGAARQPNYNQNPSLEPRVQSRLTAQAVSTDSSGRTLYQVTDDEGAYQFVPRAYQFPPAVNTTITPRISYGLMSFADIQELSFSTPDVMLCWKLLKREFSGLNPHIIHDDGEPCTDNKITRLARYPDGYHGMSVWLSRWFYNSVIYGAPALYLPRDRKTGMITGLVNVDGSTIFTLIDENAAVPAPPAPAFLQIIYGVPYGFASTEQLWYKPQELQVSSEYGMALVESAYLPAMLLNKIWQYQTAWFTTGTMPEYVVNAPPGWTNDQVAAWLVTKSQALQGNPELRTQFDVWPAGFTQMASKSVEFRKDIYDTAKRELMEHAGIPIAEVGDTQGRGGLGGKGLMDAMSQQVFRKSFLPAINATAEPFNDVLAINKQECDDGEVYHRFEWSFPKESIDPAKEREKVNEDFQNGGLTLGEYREAIGQERFKDQRDDLIYLKGGAFIAPDGTVWANAGKQQDPGADPAQFPGVQIPGQKPPQPNAQHAPGLPPGAPSGPTQAAADAPGSVQNLSKSAEHDGVIALRVPAPIANDIFLQAQAQINAGLDALETPDQYVAWGGEWNDFDLAKRANTLAKHCGVCPPTDEQPGDDAYYGAPIMRSTTVDAPINGANGTEIVAVSPKGLDSRPFAWKPEGDENAKLNEQIGHPQYLAEEACYLIDRTLQLFLVPVSFVAELEGEGGAAIHWVLNSGEILHANDYAEDWVQAAAVLDFICGQTDRTHNPHKLNTNYLTHPDDPSRPILIDNGLAFPVAESPRKIASDFINAWGDQQIDPDLLDAVAALRDNTVIWKRVAHLVGADPVAQALERIDTLVSEGAIPEQASD